MSEMYLRQPGFTYIACGPFTKKHDMAYGDFKDLTRRTASDKVLHDKGLILQKILTDAYQKVLALMVYKFFHKKYHMVVVLKMKISQTKNQLKKYSNQLLEN